MEVVYVLVDASDHTLLFRLHSTYPYPPVQRHQNGTYGGIRTVRAREGEPEASPSQARPADLAWCVLY